MADFLLPAGWALVLAALALWWGERARRIDAQRREERLPVIVPEPARPAQARIEQTAAPEFEATDEGKSRYVERMAAQGYDPLEAAADWDRMMERTHSDARAG